MVELCALLQCLGFSVKSLDSNDVNMSQQEAGARTVVINCQVMGNLQYYWSFSIWVDHLGTYERKRYPLVSEFLGYNTGP